MRTAALLGKLGGAGRDGEPGGAGASHGDPRRGAEPRARRPDRKPSSPGSRRTSWPSIFADRTPSRSTTPSRRSCTRRPGLMCARCGWPAAGSCETVSSRPSTGRKRCARPGYGRPGYGRGPRPARRVRGANLDPEELERFERLAARWWNPEGDFRPLHDVNPVRLDFIDERAALHGRTVLDVGCGGGLLAEAMHRRGARVTGIDAGGDRDCGRAPAFRRERRRRELRTDHRGGARRTGAGPVRRGDLPRAPRARARSGVPRLRVRRPRAPRRPPVLLDHQPYAEVVAVRGRRGGAHPRPAARAAPTTTAASCGPPSSIERRAGRVSTSPRRPACATTPSPAAAGSAGDPT